MIIKYKFLIKILSILFLQNQKMVYICNTNETQNTYKNKL
jgi:hypothetical protein